MRVLFVIKQIDFADHIAIPHLSAVAREIGWQTDLCVLDATDLSEKVAEFRPDVVAYSANVLTSEALSAAHQAARNRFSFTSIMGGPHPTFSPETFAQAGVDAYCVGEGESAFHDFLLRVEAGQSFDDVANLITANGRNDVRPLVSPLDELPFPDRDITLAGTYLRTTPKKTFYATRGCPFSCNYCCNNYYRKLYQGKGPIVRRFSVERVLREIEYVQSRYRTDFIKFGDDLFAMKADEWLMDFAEQYPRRIGVPFNCYLRIDRVDSDLLGLLKRAGCYSVHLSVDSTSEKIREEVLGRKMKNVDLAEQLRMIHRFGINTWVNFMLAAPESTLQDDLSTIALSRKGKVTYASYTTTVPMKGTALYDYSVDRGLLDPQTHDGDMTGCLDVSTLKGWSLREKRIRHNILLLGAIIARLPFPLDRVMTQVIKVTPPNRVFKKLRQAYYRRLIENRIFNLHWRERGNATVGSRAVVGEDKEKPQVDHASPAGGPGPMREFSPSSGRNAHQERASCSKAQEY